MDEDDEIQSHHSPETGSPVSPPPNGRITVTVATAPPAAAQNALAMLALPVQRARSGGGGSGGGGGGGGGGREDCWSEDATSVLIDAWGERYLQLSRGNLKQKHWKEVADIVSSREDYGKTPKTDIQCKNRIDTVKKKYKLEKAKVSSGGGPSKWTFFERLEQLIGPTAKIAVSSPSPPLQQSKVPMGIPVRIRSSSVNLLSNNSNNSQFHNKQPQKKQEEAVILRTQQLGKRGRTELESESEADSMDSFGLAGAGTGTATKERKRPRRMMVMAGRERRGGGKGGWGNAVRELTQAIVRFGEAYEQAESAKLQQVVEMEKQRMKFAKELELQRMQFFMKTQLEISQLKKHGGRRGGGGGAGNASNHLIHSNNNTNNNNSDSSN
ncbi:trihelix transcription factor ASIL2 [Alnus glutinosa]|uniref:trihelix transcription factor ASIL2 n=1 Tax=Alnus glutinosa TaxID=3517 RepID=UPI002D789874|nr:trihelix transcription factor ASIL2 [Alnus glutinosa]